jgi:hypothetical protein
MAMMALTIRVSVGDQVAHEAVVDLQGVHAPARVRGSVAGAEVIDGDVPRARAIWRPSLARLRARLAALEHGALGSSICSIE